MREGQRGLCFVRMAKDGKIVLTTYGRSSGFCIDPIEKKPLNHFLPGTSVLSFGTAGCNLACTFCQNWDISKARNMDNKTDLAMPHDLARAVQKAGCRSVAFTYNDPVVFMEYAVDVAQACRERGVRTVAITAGYMNDAPRREFYANMDAANIDLKGFTPEFYRRYTKSELSTVLDTLLYLKHDTNVWFEITTLLIPGENDSDEELTKECQWIMDNLGFDVPLHFTAFHPDYRMRDRPPTSESSLKRARRIAMDQGLRYVYTGNIHDPEGGSTYCPICRKCIIGRDWHNIIAWNLNAAGNCTGCGHCIPGIFEERAGLWGRKRLPVRVVGDDLVTIMSNNKGSDKTTRTEAEDKPMQGCSTYTLSQNLSKVVLPSQVAGTFYPKDQGTLAKMVDRLMVQAPVSLMAPKALIVPHAGYQYSGTVAACAYAALGQRVGNIRRVVLAGPAHRMAVNAAVVPRVDAMMTPLGFVSVDQSSLTRLKTLESVREDDEPFQGEHGLEVHLPFLQRTMKDFTVIPILIGQTTAEQAALILDAVWGGPETLVVISSDLSHFYDSVTARHHDDEATAAIESLRSDKLLDAHACGRNAVRGLLTEAVRRNLRATAIDMKNSGDVTGNNARVVGYGAYVFEPAEEARLPACCVDGLLHVAQTMIVRGVGTKNVPRMNVNGVPRPLLSHRAAFTTIRHQGQLRGCRGSSVVQRSLVADVAYNAWLSAYRDSRFCPLNQDDFASCDISISILNAVHRLPCDSEEMLLAILRPGIDGLIISDGEKRGLFLPSVWNQIPEPGHFLRALKRKAGLPESHWSPTVEMFRFTAEKMGPVPLLKKLLV